MAAGGAACGVLVPALLGLGKWWVLFILLGLGTVVAAVLSGDPRRVLVLSLALILPANADIHFFDQNLRVSLSSLVGLALWGLWILGPSARKGERLGFFPKITVPAVAFLLITFLSLLANSRGSYLPLLRIFEPICDFLIYLYVANYIRTEKDVRQIVYLLVAGGLLQCFAAIAELWTQIELDLLFGHSTVAIWQQPVGTAQYARISGLMEHANILAIYLSCIVVMLITLAFVQARRGIRVAIWLAVGLAVYVIINTFSRSAWFVFSVFVPFMFVLQLWKLRSMKRLVLPAVLCAGVVLVGGLTSPGKIVDRISVDRSVMSRRYMMEIGANVVKDNPVLGVGFRNYLSNMYRYDDTDVAITSVFPGILHNVYLLIASEQGVLGLLAFLWLNYAICITGWRFVAGKPDFLGNMGLSFFFFILMFLAYGMANPFPRFTYIYLPLGMLAAIAHLEGRRQDGADAAGREETTGGRVR